MFRLRNNPLPHQCLVCCCRKPHTAHSRYCAKHDKRKWRAEHPIIDAWRRLIDSARQRHKEFALTTADFIDFLESTDYIDGRGRHRLCLQIDRKDHTRGYTRDNIQVLTCSQNTAKGNQERRIEIPF